LKKQALGRGFLILHPFKRSRKTILNRFLDDADKVVGIIIEFDLKTIEINCFNQEVLQPRIFTRISYTSIKELGEIQPITVRKLDFNKYHQFQNVVCVLPN
jgi:ParB family chromosome partitioning protein